MSVSTPFPARIIRSLILAALLLLGWAADALLGAPTLCAEKAGEWTVDIMAQSDSRAELRPCT